jgi:hypothetical protein
MYNLFMFYQTFRLCRWKMTSAPSGTASTEKVLSSTALPGATDQQFDWNVSYGGSSPDKTYCNIDSGAGPVVGSCPTSSHSQSIYYRSHDYEELPNSRFVKFAIFH